MHSHGGHAIAAKTTRTAVLSVWRFGLWAVLSMSALTAVTSARAFAIPPRSGPFCTLGSCVIAPYTNVAALFPIELAVISIDWLVLSISGILVIIVFNRAGRDDRC
jgi:hypothetical protein